MTLLIKPGSYFQPVHCSEFVYWRSTLSVKYHFQERTRRWCSRPHGRPTDKSISSKQQQHQKEKPQFPSSASTGTSCKESTSSMKESEGERLQACSSRNMQRLLLWEARDKLKIVLTLFLALKIKNYEIWKIKYSIQCARLCGKGQHPI